MEEGPTNDMGRVRSRLLQLPGWNLLRRENDPSVPAPANDGVRLTGEHFGIPVGSVHPELIEIWMNEELDM